MNATLITFLGKGRDNPQTGYREATYQFADQSQRKTPFFGLALAEHLQPRVLIILGTAGSMWGVLIEYFAEHDHHEELRLELMEAESQGAVTQDLLDRVTPLLQASTAHEIQLRLIPSGQIDQEQIGILEAIDHTLDKQPTRLHIDITHGFRHLAIIGFLSAAMLERLRPQLHVEALWYGALDMTSRGMTPVIRLDGLNAVHRWVSALDRFDANGDYGVFAPLLEADGLPVDKARCLSDAAFYEATTQIPNAARSLRTLLPELEGHALPGASALFQVQLKKRLQWARFDNLAEQQRILALRALTRGDLLRTAILGLESLISKLIQNAGRDPYDFQARKIEDEQLQQEIREGQHPDWLRDAYWNLKNLRNSMAHGTPPTYSHLQQLIKNPERLRKELESTLGRLNASHFS
ncbi:MAG: TIGR02221 family CRISPR-associated protein [Thiomonas sp.]|uniref:TIGR02221 family CRISPR-associated protein n=1 Tax=Thiomonas sp. TaxID=2047785 RepID=UPI002A361CDA|nr:TIGR02221 family CRISPR-associated protein [Thiomonas sp.]MDY0331681.1 TIGR02221 family CRISPR-associated protein [Thiomonas sp.]